MDMSKQVVCVVLGISIVSLIGVCLFQRQQVQRLSAEHAALSKKLEQSAQAKNKRTVAKTETKKVSDAKPQEEMIEARPAQVDATPAPAPESPMQDIAKIMKNTGMKEMIRAQQKGQLEMMYGPLFKCLQLSDAELESFKNLLLDKQMALVDNAMDMMNSAATPEEKKAAADRIKEMTASYDAQCKTLLGDENYTLYKSFEETQPERMQVSMFKGSLGSTDPLSEEQEDSLIRAMHEERSNFKSAVPGFGDQQMQDPSQFTPENITQLLEESAKLQEKYVTKAATILTPPQLEQFKANQKQQRAMQEMGMKMAEKMFGQGKAAPVRAQPGPAAP
jgi:hypothetical protein